MVMILQSHVPRHLIPLDGQNPNSNFAIHHAEGVATMIEGVGC